MKQSISLILCGAVMSVMTACGGDDTVVPPGSQDDDAAQNVRIGHRLNLNLTSLPLIVNAIETKDYVASYNSRKAENNLTEYHFKLERSGSFSVVVGGDDASASLPAIGTRQDENGAYYWTANGEWLKGNDGKRIKTNVTGQPLPTLKYDGGAWLVSTDRQSSWQMIDAPADAADIAPHMIFSSIDFQTPKRVSFVQADGTRLELPTEYSIDTFSPENFSLGGYPVHRITDDGFISVKVPYGTPVGRLVADFRLSDGCRVTVDGQLQVSGKTENDFAMPVEYVVTNPDGEKKTYIVGICYSDLPMLYIDTAGRPIVSKEEYVKNIEVTVMNGNDARYEGARIKGRGNTSWNMPKKNYTLKLESKAPLAGLKKHKTFTVTGNYADKTLMRNSWAYQMGRDVYNDMDWNPTVQQAHFVLNGEYLGVFGITEAIKINENRVNVPNMEDCNNDADAAKYGFILEVDNRAADETFVFSTGRNTFQLKDPDGDDISEGMKEFIRKTITDAETAVFSGNTDQSSKSYYGNYIDVPSIIDWYLVNEIFRNCDATFHTSVYMYYDPADQKVHMGPLWDFDIGAGNINYAGCDNPEGFHIKGAGWFGALFRDPNFVKSVKKRWNERHSQLVSYVDNLMIAQARELEADAVINFKRWNILGIYVWPNAAGYQSRTTYWSEVEYINNWLDRRIVWLDRNINAL